jgi:zinc finger SWIM domain-containing protein 3
MLAEDRNGESEIVAVFLVANEEGSTIKKMVEIFKKYNPSWTKTETIMSDKDFTEREVFASEFPQANLFICLFHVQRTLRREVTTEKMGITSEERNLCLELLQKLTYATTLEQYKQLRSELHATDIESVVNYFEENWHPINVQWVEGLKSRNTTYLNRTNNRVESINQKIKSVCSNFSDLGTFFDELLLAIQSLRNARDHRAIVIMQKRAVVPYSSDSVEAAYMQVLTPYAFSFVVKQIELCEKVKLPDHASFNETVEIITSATTVKTSHFSCECSFWTAMNLPCRHIIALRKAAGVSMFDANLIATRCKMDYYRSKHCVLKDSRSGGTLPATSTSCVVEPPTVSILSQGQKYRKAFQLCQQALLCCVRSTNETIWESHAGFETPVRIMERW